MRGQTALFDELWLATRTLLRRPGHLIVSSVFGVEAFNPVTYGIVGGSIVAVTLLATVVPALRALHVAPVQAQRYE